jgi:hypothetical protein
VTGELRYFGGVPEFPWVKVNKGLHRDHIPDSNSPTRWKKLMPAATTEEIYHKQAAAGPDATS